MRQVSFDEWCDAIDAEAAARKAAGDISHGYFRDAGSDAMEYVSRGQVVARSEGYDTDVKRYYVQAD